MSAVLLILALVVFPVATYGFGFASGISCNWLTQRVAILRRATEPGILRDIRADAWAEGWDEARRIKSPACPDDHNPYVKETQA